MTKVVYIADIGGDIDDLIAIQYLNSIDRLDCVVLDGRSIDHSRIAKLENDNIKIVDYIPSSTRVVFCGGAFTAVNDFLKHSKLDLFVANGFFAGVGVVEEADILPKFTGLAACRSYNPELDYIAAAEIIYRHRDQLSYFVSKNVCHHENNIVGKWHTEQFNCRPNKKLHDVLMVKEGLNILDKRDTLCAYEPVHIYRESNNRWSCAKSLNSNHYISVKYK